MLNLMYITKRPEIAQIAEEAGVDWIFVDMEFIGKNSRQGGLDTVQNHHTVEDVANVKATVQKAKILVRVNPIHEALADYPSSQDEIESVIKAGADIIIFAVLQEGNRSSEVSEHSRWKSKDLPACGDS
ncbi:hypothetical protein NXW13_18290 [Bacteroides thetaiotaomicron]|nr:hypothetical protein [Bacteroides thetaiotaomicron]